MEMTVLCVLLAMLAIALVGLLFSRIHFHFSFNLTVSRSPKGKARRVEISGEVPPAVRSIRDPGVTSAIESARKSAEADINSALVNLGCEKGKAAKVAKAAMLQGSDFETRVKWAMVNAA